MVFPVFIMLLLLLSKHHEGGKQSKMQKLEELHLGGKGERENKLGQRARVGGMLGAGLSMTVSV